MKIESVHLKLATKGERSRGLIRAFGSLEFEGGYVLRNLKVIETKGRTVLVMPSRKITDRCPACEGKNHLKARFCNRCGRRLKANRYALDDAGRPKLYEDQFYPVDAPSRRRLEAVVFRRYLDLLAAEHAPPTVAFVGVFHPQALLAQTA